MGVIVLAAAVLAAGMVALYRRRTDGRFRRNDIRPLVVEEKTMAEQSKTTGEVRLGSSELGTELGARATVVQFSSSFCAPCRSTRVLLADVTSRLDQVKHVEIDAESHLDLVRRLNILRTPTVLILDGRGRIVERAAGVPSRQGVLAAIAIAAAEPDGQSISLTESR